MTDYTFNPFTGEFETDSCGDEIAITHSDEVKVTNEMLFSVLQSMLEELKIMNSHLSTITDEEKTLDDTY